MMNRLFLVLALAALPLMAACNTFEGVGQDVKAAGSGIENAAEKSK